MKFPYRRRARIRSRRTRLAVRAGLVTASCLGIVATAAGVSGAVGFGDGPTPGVAVADDYTHALANPGHRDRFDASFTVHQYGVLFAASARNQATADSAYCDAADPCRSVALSFQIVTMAGTNIHLNAVNLSHAANVHCDGCLALAGAYQFVVSTPGPFTLSSSAQAQLDAIHRKLDALRTSTASAADIQSQVDALAGQVTTILQAAAATAKGPVAYPLVMARPEVTMHRMFAQN